MDRRKILYILLVFFGLSLFYRMATVPEEKRAPLKYKTGTEAVVKKEAPDKLVPASSKQGSVQGQAAAGSSGYKDKGPGDEEIPEIELSRLRSVKRMPPSGGINLFYPFFIKAEPPKPQPVPVFLPPPVDPLEEELKLFRFMGFMEKKESSGRDKKIFLAKDQNTYIVKSGDIVEGKFKINVMEKSIEISAINSNKKITIPIEEK